jgi:hypothetical protein
MEEFTSLSMPKKEEETMASEIQAKLDKQMGPSDRFMNSDGYPVEKSTEGTTNYERLLVKADTGSEKVSFPFVSFPPLTPSQFICIVTKEKKENIALQAWPSVGLQLLLK